MIPPLAPGQINEQQNMVGWKNTFNMRQITFSNLVASKNTGGSFNYPGCVTSPIKSLDILRRNLQNAINRDIDTVIKKYLEKFFQPAVSNIRTNLGKGSINDDIIKGVCQQMLEEAKVMYKKSSSLSRDSSPCDYSDSEGGSFADCRIEPMSPTHLKRKESDTDSETGYAIGSKRLKMKTSKSIEQFCHHKLPEKREGPKWDPERINESTLFIMGARANKVLGFGQTRGRLYVRHPNMLRYSGDPEDKEWLASKNLMPPSGGRAYLMLLEDIQELAANDDYRNSPNLQLGELQGFEAPLFMINKIKAFLEQVRTDKKIARHHHQHHHHSSFHHSLNTITISDPFDFRQAHSLTPIDSSAPSTPSDTKQSDIVAVNGLIHIPETSPVGSTNSFVSSGQFGTTSNNSLSPNTLMGHGGISIDTSNNNGDSLLDLVENVHAEKILVNLLSAHTSNENSSQDF